MPRKSLIPVFLMLLVFGLPAEEEEGQFTVLFAPYRIEWNPHYAFTVTEAQVFTAVYEGLVSFHPGTLRPVPAAAESWEFSEDNKRITFKLRENILWSNGENLSASDFRESWLTILSPETEAEYASLFDDIVGAREYRSGLGLKEDVGIEAPDATTLVVSLKQPSPQFISILCHYSFVPIHRDFRKLHDWSAIRSVPVNGPFIIRARNEKEILLDKNPLYWDAESLRIDRLRIVFSDDANQIMKDFNRLEIDWVTSGIDSTQLAIPEALNITPQFSTTYYYFSNNSKVWADSRVRRALTLLLPLDELREERLIPGVSLVPPIPNYPAAEANFPAPEKRMEEAIKLLEEAGFPGGKGLPSPVIRVPPDDSVAKLMKDTWSETLGLYAIIEEVIFADYYDAVKAGGYDLATLTWTGDYADPHTFLGMWNSQSSFNESGFSNPEYDALLNEAATLPFLQRFEKLREAESLLLFSCQVIPIEHYPAVNLIDRRFVEGWFPNALDIHPFKHLSPRLGFDIPGVAKAELDTEPFRNQQVD
ncbi:Oligopeptide ABC transporter, periplasmic oligopeptide-binding protein OppA (TC 3.A.1.5.1) [Olavius algarvensis spirochete endosymbiont]|uniref:peptide ABC transporter substrate-binding protein n=1 Tax=Olavius algarvensis spirochete endosymbiont TaxID=260710 RepID=UPI00068E7F03|nr:peptide ABC transporter substrate-binding protein [Olavius algarvensis spirochete endosymbiont]CAD7839441.1 MAG: hypothetical protein [Olavius algarvensis spirochete endosymbiont]VDA99720.1 Oligopeptide ABC transporter, periplasmic oligopeptide-binding protein OppA (TC 3.A.1.5.1) [Olavius algarvensis spirochete endosymbiont]